MFTRPLTKQDYDHIVQVVDRWWGAPAVALAHPVFFYELGGMARVAERDAMMVGFLFGFIAPGPPRTGYVHLVGIHPDHRREGIAKVLYQSFEEDCRTEGCVALKAVAHLCNESSERFHEAIGWCRREVDGYAGPGRLRSVYEKSLSEACVGEALSRS